MERTKKFEALEVIALIVTPGMGSVYFGAATFLNIPGTTYVLGTLTILALVFGFVVVQMKKRYSDEFDGELHLMELEDDKTRYSLVLHSDPEKLTDKKVITFEVVSNRG